MCVNMCVCVGGGGGGNIYWDLCWFQTILFSSVINNYY